MEQNRATIRMQFADGEEMFAWLSFRLRDHFTDPLGGLDFEAAPPRARIAEYRERLRKGQIVSVLVNSANQGTFLIVERRTTIGREGVTFSVTCRSVLATAYEGSVEPKLSFKHPTDTPVGTAVLAALEPYGFDSLIGDNAANASLITGKPIGGGATAVVVDALKHQEAQAQDGETAYGFGSRIFSRLGVALRVAADGTLLLAAPDYDQEAAYTVVQDFDGGTAGDRFLADPPIEEVDTNEGQFASCTVRGSRADNAGTTQTAAPRATVTAAELNPRRPAYISEAAAHKPLELKDKNARDVERCRNVAKLALGIRAAKAYVITGRVDGLVSQTGRVWSVNTVVRVVIEAYGLDEDMWIIGRDLMGSRDRGQMTRLEIIPKGALVLGDVPSG